jgi:peptidoglycan hydrolase CwlO-like protein
MVTLGTAFEDLDNELESMLDMVSEALDLMEKNKKEEAMEVLADLEDAMLDFLDYEEVDEEEAAAEVVVEEPKKAAASKKAPAKAAPKKAAPAKKAAAKPKKK